MPRRASAALAGALALASPGCGAAALIHDAYIGPISPAGYVHPLVTGVNFRVDELGPTVDTSDEALLRPFPRDILERGSTFVPLVRGLEFGVAGFSFFVDKRTQTGVPTTSAQRAKLRVGMSVQEVLAVLGPPRQWIKRKGASFMAYSAEVGRDLDLHLGVPPGVGDLIPIPGVTSISFAWSSKDRAPHKTILFFDAQETLASVVTNEAQDE